VRRHFNVPSSNVSPSEWKLASWKEGKQAAFFRCLNSDIALVDMSNKAIFAALKNNSW